MRLRTILIDWRAKAFDVLWTAYVMVVFALSVVSITTAALVLVLYAFGTRLFW